MIIVPQCYPLSRNRRWLAVDRFQPQRSGSIASRTQGHPARPDCALGRRAGTMKDEAARGIYGCARAVRSRGSAWLRRERVEAENHAETGSRRAAAARDSDGEARAAGAGRRSDLPDRRRRERGRRRLLRPRSATTPGSAPTTSTAPTCPRSWRCCTVAGCRGYVTLNTLVFPAELADLEATVRELAAGRRRRRDRAGPRPGPADPRDRARPRDPRLDPDVDHQRGRASSWRASSAARG